MKTLVVALVVLQAVALTLVIIRATIELRGAAQETDVSAPNLGGADSTMEGTLGQYFRDAMRFPSFSRELMPGMSDATDRPGISWTGRNVIREINLQEVTRHSMRVTLTGDLSAAGLLVPLILTWVSGDQSGEEVDQLLVPMSAHGPAMAWAELELSPPAGSVGGQVAASPSPLQISSLTKGDESLIRSSVIAAINETRIAWRELAEGLPDSIVAARIIDALAENQ